MVYTSMTYCPLTAKTLRIISVRCIPLRLRSKTRRIATLLLPTWTCSSIDRDGQLCTSFYNKRDDFNFHTCITNFPFLRSNIPSSPAYAVFISQLIRYARACSSYECFILRAMQISNKLLGQGYFKERLKSSPRKQGSSMVGTGILSNNMNSPSPECYMTFWRMTIFIDTPIKTLHQFLTLILISTLLLNFTFYLIVRGIHRTFATGAACQQRTLTPPDTWSCPTLGLTCVLNKC